MRIAVVASSICVAFTVVSSGDEEAFVAPGENLVVSGIPPIPGALASEVRRYTEFRRASFSSWHPGRREMLVSTRFGDASQVHHVAFPGGARRQITFSSEPLGGASYQPTHGRYFVFRRDRGGDEFYQIYRFDLDSARESLLTDGEKRHTLGPWSKAGDWLAYQKVDADEEGAFTELRVIRPDGPETARVICKVRGGGWRIQDWSPDDQTLLAVETISVNVSNLWLIDVKTGARKRLTPEYYLEELGVAVIYPNVRGSLGYGKTFLKLDNGPRRADAYKDIEALLDWIVGHDECQSIRTGKSGRSREAGRGTSGASRVKKVIAPISLQNHTSWAPASK